MRVIKSATFKLTLWYLGIIMVLSIIFSFALYHASSSQLIDSEQRQSDAIGRLFLPPQLEQTRETYEQRLYDDLQNNLHHIQTQMLGLNLLTLLVGGGLSYALARRTLLPVEEALEAQGRFTADASHELRTPLTVMRSEIEVALRGQQLSASEARQLLGSNLEEIAKLEALSASLLRLARFENGLDLATISFVPTAELFEAAIERFHAKLKHKHMKTEVSTGGETVPGDRDSLVELVAVLLDNAIKYSPEHSTIKLGSQAQGQVIRLSVADEGVGVKAEDMPHIFDRFYRADRSRSKDVSSGYGLGLSIAKRITDLHRGQIYVESLLGSGATFYVKLPANQAQAAHALNSFFSGFGH
jgi:two-component system sensor histidine kinase CiaH